MKEERPWGWYNVIEQGERFKVKNIEVKKHPLILAILRKYHYL